MPKLDYISEPEDSNQIALELMRAVRSGEFKVIPPATREEVDGAAEMRELLAISLKDLLEQVPEELRIKLTAGRLGVSKTVGAGRDDDPAVVFKCDLLAAAAVCDLIHSNDRETGNPPTGVYLYRNSAWWRVTNQTVLTILDGGAVRLNPAVFSVPVELAPMTAPVAKRVRL